MLAGAFAITFAYIFASIYIKVKYSYNSDTNDDVFVMFMAGKVLICKIIFSFFLAKKYVVIL